jgi:hypothetical protein
MKLKIQTIAAAALLSASSYSMAVNIGGLALPVGPELQIASVFENVVTGVGQTLSGYGEISQINGQPLGALCSGCELTYSFTGYTVTSLTANAITFTGGTINLYLGFGANNDFNPFNSANSAQDLAAATNGTLFLTLKGHAIDGAGNTFAGSGNNIGGANAAGNGSGLADVAHTGGIADAYFDTNGVASLFGGPADIQLGSSFSNVFLPHPGECRGAAPTGIACLAGSADLRGVVAAPVPEPSTYALLAGGLGLIGTFVGRRRQG